MVCGSKHTRLDELPTTESDEEIEYEETTEESMGWNCEGEYVKQSTKIKKPLLRIRQPSVGSLLRKDTGFASATNGIFIRRKSHLDTESPTTKQPTKRFFTRQESINDEADLWWEEKKKRKASRGFCQKCFC